MGRCASSRSPDAAGEVPVATALRDRVLGSIAATDAPSVRRCRQQRRTLRRAVRRWQVTSALVGAAAAVLAVVVAVDRLRPTPQTELSRC
jgi:hypothetical protein